MKKYSAYLFLPLLICFALCITSCDDEDDTFSGEWNVVSMTQQIGNTDAIGTNASGTITLNEDGSGSNDYTFDFTNPATSDEQMFTALSDFDWSEMEDVLRFTKADGGIEDWDRSVNTNSRVVMSRQLNISNFTVDLVLTMEK